MTGHRIVLALAFVSAMVGCNRTLRSPSDEFFLPLPPLDRVKCCWMKEEKVVVSRGGEDQSLHFVLLRNDDNLVVVALDGLSHRRLTLTYDGSTIAEELVPDNWPPQASRFMLASILLHYSPAGSWASATAQWEVSQRKQRKALRFKGEEVIIIMYQAENGADKQQTRHVVFPGNNMVLDAITLSSKTL